VVYSNRSKQIVDERNFKQYTSLNLNQPKIKPQIEVYAEWSGRPIILDIFVVSCCWVVFVCRAVGGISVRRGGVWVCWFDMYSRGPSVWWLCWLLGPIWRSQLRLVQQTFRLSRDLHALFLHGCSSKALLRFELVHDVERVTNDIDWLICYVLARDAMLARYAVVVFLSMCVSVTRRYCIKIVS